MSLISFIKDAGEKLFNKSQAAGSGSETASPASNPSASPGTATAQLNVADLNAKAGQAIQAYVQQQNLGIEDLGVQYDGASEKVTITGRAPSQEAAEKAVLSCGNVSHVASVDNQLTVTQQAAEVAQFHDVVKGDTLSAISKKYYGDANKYNAIFEANRPMLSSPDKIYPGQKLRIPKLT
jgi:nucleoid-associated protein YgaU